jgi:hypothetical protein
MDYVLKGEYFDGTGFKGEIVIDMPALVERLKLSAGAGLDKHSPDAQAGQMEIAITLAEIASTRIKSVNVVHEESGLEIKDAETFLCASESSPLIYKIGSSILQGNVLGKKSGS